MAVESDHAAARPSLYALICLARHVQRVRQLLKARVQAHKSPLLTDHREQFVHLASTEAQSIIKSLKRRPDRPPPLPRVGRNALGSTEIGFTTLLRNLDHQIEEPDYRPLVETAAQESLFLGHNARYSHPTNLAEACHVFDLSTSLLARLEGMQARGCGAGPKNDSHCHQTVWSIQDEKTIANLEHLLRCLQQDAWNALVQHFLRVIDADRDHWGRYWQQIEQLDDGWFAEWPNGRRPLSTTWPWNIKPSLVILWGVCWMFIYPKRDTHYDTGRRQGGGRLQVSNNAHARAYAHGPAHAPYGQDVPPGYVMNNSRWQEGLVAEISPAAALSRLSPAPASATAPATARLSDFSLAPSPAQARTCMQPHMQFATPYQAEAASSPLRYRPDHPLQPLAASSSSAYNPSTTDLSLDYDSALTDFSLTIPSSNDSQHVWLSNFGNWQQPSRQSAPLSLGPPEEPLQRNQVPHASAYPRLPTSYTPEVTLSPHPVDPSFLESQLFPRMPGTKRNSSPCSENSDGRQCPPDGPSPNSEQTRRASSMSVGSSRPGVSPTQARSEEPPRDAEGNMFCSHADCLNQRKTFQRKCEWSKHMDKHERPHKCTVDGCEKLSGFTYAGGLLRHEREVHNMYGGPKASRMCPHADCKRSTGVGFTRKENLQEHLRRVHRGVEDRLPKLEQEQAPSGDLGSSRKRRRVPPEEDPNNTSDEDSEDRHESVKRLKQEVVVLQEKVQRLENMVMALMPRNNRRSS